MEFTAKLFEQEPVDLEKEKGALIMEAQRLNDQQIVKLAKLLGYAKVEGPEEAIKFVLMTIQEASNKSELETIQMKMTNMDQIEVK